jgi:hypothetical protein
VADTPILIWWIFRKKVDADLRVGPGEKIFQKKKLNGVISAKWRPLRFPYFSLCLVYVAAFARDSLP